MRNTILILWSISIVIVGLFSCSKEENYSNKIEVKDKYNKTVNKQDTVSMKGNEEMVYFIINYFSKDVKFEELKSNENLEIIFKNVKLDTTYYKGDGITYRKDNGNGAKKSISPVSIKCKELNCQSGDLFHILIKQLKTGLSFEFWVKVK